jgi:adenine-specific DNA glycosylase
MNYQYKRLLKSIFWLIASNARGEVLGGKRASSGVWGGMYAFPEFESEGDLRDAVPQGVNLRVLTVLRHELTHQSLSIHGFASLSEPKHRPKVRTASPKTALDPWGSWAGFQWMSMKDWAQVGRPKPVEDFLNQTVQAGHAW